MSAQPIGDGKSIEKDHAQSLHSGAGATAPRAEKAKTWYTSSTKTVWGAIVNSSRGIIAAYKQETYAKYGEENFADASRAAVEDMIADIRSAL